MLNTKSDKPRRRLTFLLSSVVIAAMALQLQSCDDEFLASSLHSTAEQRDLIRTLYGNSHATIFWWPRLEDAPTAVQAAAERARSLTDVLSYTGLSAFSIAYPSNDLPQIALWIRRAGNQDLLIYNHGHGGLPQPGEEFAVRLLQLSLDAGSDLLLTSMPQTGLNSPNPETEYHIRTRDAEASSPVDPVILDTFSSRHALYELVDDPDSYIHYFIDSAVMPAALLAPHSLRSTAPTELARPGNEPPQDPQYRRISYVGLSGGATTGLTACSVLSLERCVLIAGVMPDDLRIRYFGNFGDSEQQSRSIYKQFPVSRLLPLARDTTTKLTLLFNAQDPCCFADPSASELQQRYIEYDIRVLPLDFHGYEPEMVMDILL